jgi:hypothetical protein
MSNHLQSPDDMTPEQLARALANVHILETWIHAVKGHAFELLKAGTLIPGWKLGYGARKRIWKDGVQAAALAAFKALDIPEEELFTKPEFITPPQVEKVLKAHGKWPRKRRGDPTPPATPLDGFIERSMPEPRVMPMGDEDEALDKLKDAQNEFET